MTLLIAGADGQLGRAIANTVPDGVTVVAYSRAELDITNASQVEAIVGAVRPSVVINCAAVNDVDAAEDEQVQAFEVNAMAVGSLARAARRAGSTFVHYSTDFVFDGTSTRPYTEEDAPEPRSVYAASKLVGEWMAADAGRWFVLRVESLFGVAHVPQTRRVGSIDRIIGALERRESVKVFRDRVVSPSYVLDVCEATHQLIAGTASSGVYHVVNTGFCTWFELAQQIAARVGGADGLIPIDASSLQLRAARPQFAALSNARLASAAYQMPTWEDAIARYISFRQSSATI